MGAAQPLEQTSRAQQQAALGSSVAEPAGFTDEGGDSLQSRTSISSAAPKAAGLERSDSIYDVRSPARRNVILGVAALTSILLPFCDTIYLPALKALQDDLDTTEEMATASVAIYMFCVGIAALFWGPFADRYGRRLTYWLSMGGFLATSIVCIFAPNIGVLVAFRALQGACVASTVTIGNAVVADLFPPEQRGTASGVFLIPMLVGPILGPLVGGAISQAFGWRGTFVCLTIFAGVIFALLLIFFPETHHHYVLRSMSATQPDEAAALAELHAIEEPRFQAPWAPLMYLREVQVAVPAACAFILFGSMFASLVQLPIMLAEPPYSYSETIIGVLYLPNGVGSFLGSPVGGKLADVAAERFGWRSAEGRLLPAMALVLVLETGGLLLYGWTFDAQINVAAPMVAQFINGVAIALFLPAIFSFLSVAKQQEAGAAAAVVQSLMFVGAGLWTMVSPTAVKSIGMGPFFSILAGLCCLATGAGLLRVLSQLQWSLAGAPAAGAAADVEVGGAAVKGSFATRASEQQPVGAAAAAAGGAGTGLRAPLQAARQ